MYFTFCKTNLRGDAACFEDSSLVAWNLVTVAWRAGILHKITAMYNWTDTLQSAYSCVCSGCTLYPIKYQYGVIVPIIVIILTGLGRSLWCIYPYSYRCTFTHILHCCFIGTWGIIRYLLCWGICVKWVYLWQQHTQQKQKAVCDLIQAAWLDGILIEPVCLYSRVLTKWLIK